MKYLIALLLLTSCGYGDCFKADSNRDAPDCILDISIPIG